MALSRRKAGRAISTLMALLLVPLLSVQGQAQNLPEGDPPQDGPTADHKGVLAALEIGASSKDLGEVTDAISLLEVTIKTQLIRVTASNAELTTAHRDAVDLAKEVAGTKREVERLQITLADQAVLTFIGRETTNGLLMTGSPTVASRQDTLISQVLGSQSDTLEAIKSLSEFLKAKQIRVIQVETKAAELQTEAQQDLIELEQTQQALQETLEELLIWHKAGRGRGRSVDASDIVDAGNGILVHKAIAEDISQLLAAAKADGVVLGGGGYRDSSGQIRVRKANCGTSNYAIYEMPARNCRPATAKPGSSMHEQGLAIDFSYNGVVIGSRSGPAWFWLAEHAGEYGLRNLPSEPWHFSTNGQ